MRETKFKQTEVGLIPEDWEIRKLSSIGSLAMCKRVFQEQTTISGNIPFYKIGTFGKKADAYISEELFLQLKTSYRYPNYGDILISAAGTIGRTVVFDGKPSYFQDSNIVWLAHNQDYVLNTYLYYVYQTIKWNTEHTTIARLYNDNFNNTVISLPSLPEQSRIASALSEVDALLSSLDKVIAKKQAIKEGTMQQLLTGKKRLKGFEGEWRNVQIGNLCELYGRIGFRGYTKQDLVKQGFGAITFSPSNIHNQILDEDGYDYISFEKYEESPEIKVQVGDILFCKTASIGKCALVTRLKEKATINPQFVVLKQIKCDKKLLYYLLCSKHFQDCISGITGGSTIPTLSQEKMKALELLIPSDNAEQHAISSILSEMDNEIAALYAKRRKYEAVKQGMMQQLLTGKIRLV